MSIGELETVTYTKEQLTGQLLIDLLEQETQRIEWSTDHLREKLVGRMRRVILNKFPAKEPVRNQQKLRQLRAELLAELERLGDKELLETLGSIIRCAAIKVRSVVHETSNGLTVTLPHAEVEEEAIPVALLGIELNRDAKDDGSTSSSTRKDGRGMAEQNRVEPFIRMARDHEWSIAESNGSPSYDGDKGARLQCRNEAELLQLIDRRKYWAVRLQNAADNQRTFFVTDSTSRGVYLLNRPPESLEVFSNPDGISAKELCTKYEATYIAYDSQEQWERVMNMLLASDKRIYPLRDRNGSFPSDWTKLQPFENEAISSDLDELAQQINMRRFYDKHLKDRPGRPDMDEVNLAAWSHIDALVEQGDFPEDFVEQLGKQAVAPNNIPVSDIRVYPQRRLFAHGPVSGKYWLKNWKKWLDQGLPDTTRKFTDGHALQQVQFLAGKTNVGWRASQFGLEPTAEHEAKVAELKAANISKAIALNYLQSITGQKAEARPHTRLPCAVDRKLLAWYILEFDPFNEYAQQTLCNADGITYRANIAVREDESKAPGYSSVQRNENGGF